MTASEQIFFSPNTRRLETNCYSATRHGTAWSLWAASAITLSFGLMVANYDKAHDIAIAAGIGLAIVAIGFFIFANYFFTFDKKAAASHLRTLEKRINELAGGERLLS